MDEKLGVGEIISGTLATLGENQRTVMLFVGLMTVIGTALEWGISTPLSSLPGGFTIPESLQMFMGVGAGIGGLLALVVMVLANYLLWEKMLEQGNYLHLEGGRRFFRFIGQAFVVTILTSFAFVLLIIPGLICGARWAATPAFLIAERRGVFDSMGQSWEMVRGNTTPVVLTYLLGVLVFFIVAGALGAGTIASGGLTQDVSIVAAFFNQLVSNIATVFQVGLGMFLFQRLTGPSHAVRDVFA